MTDFTVENGATRVVPGSHRVTRPISKSFAQPLARHPDEYIAVGRAGSVLMLNGHTWHSGRQNNSTGSRRSVQMVVRRTSSGRAGRLSGDTRPADRTEANTASG
jgi:ectoine hydroxylase-related dioxygenase (phytanoyl-CoA dioxygenase family)